MVEEIPLVASPRSSHNNCAVAPLFSTTDHVSLQSPREYKPVLAKGSQGATVRSPATLRRSWFRTSSVFSTKQAEPWFKSYHADLLEVFKDTSSEEFPSSSRKGKHWMIGWLSAVPVAIPLFILSYSSGISYSEIIVSNSPLDANVIAAMHLLSSGLTGLLLPWRSPCWLIVSSADITVTIFYQHIVQDIVKQCQDNGLSEQTTAATALLALPLNTVLVSLLFWVVGHKKSTIVLSYLPYPVVAGFLATVGWAIFSGSFPVLAGHSVHIHDIPLIFQEYPAQLACTAAVVCGASLLQKLGAPPRILAIAPIILASCTFWLVLIFVVPSFASNSEVAVKERWLFPSVPQSPFWSIWTDESLPDVSLPYLLPDPYTFFSLSLVVLLSLALRVTGIEGSTGIPMNIDEEVKRTGLANLATGFCGGVIGSHSPGLTTFNMAAGSKDMRVAVIAALLQLLLWLSGLPARNILPRFMLAGILMNLGIVMLIEWMWASKAKVGWSGLVIIYVQVISSIIFGLLWSVLLGVMFTGIIYNGQLLTFSVLKYHVSGKSLRSPVRRGCNQQRLLDLEFDQVEAIGLDGYLSEGPMLRFTRYVQRYAQLSERLRFLILDFRSCHAFTPWSCALLIKMDMLLLKKNITVLYANAEPSLAKGLISFGLDTAKNRSFDTLPEALVYCEDYILASNHEQTDFRLMEMEPSEEDHILALAELLKCSPSLARQVASCGQWRVVHFGSVLASQGRLETHLHFCLPGYSVVGEHADTGRQAMGESLKIALHHLGTICGIEGVLYDECSRSTFVSQDWNCHVLRMHKDAFKKLSEQEPTIMHCIVHFAALQFLHRGDYLAQVVDVAKGGGWRGARFDEQTSKIASSLLQEQPLFFQRQMSGLFKRSRGFCSA